MEKEPDGGNILERDLIDRVKNCLFHVADFFKTIVEYDGEQFTICVRPVFKSEEDFECIISQKLEDGASHVVRFLMKKEDYYEGQDDIEISGLWPGGDWDLPWLRAFLNGFKSRTSEF